MGSYLLTIALVWLRWVGIYCQSGTNYWEVYREKMVIITNPTLLFYNTIQWKCNCTDKHYMKWYYNIKNHLIRKILIELPMYVVYFSIEWIVCPQEDSIYLKFRIFNVIFAVDAFFLIKFVDEFFFMFLFCQIWWSCWVVVLLYNQSKTSLQWEWWWFGAGKSRLLFCVINSYRFNTCTDL